MVEGYLTRGCPQAGQAYATRSDADKRAEKPAEQKYQQGALVFTKHFFPGTSEETIDRHLRGDCSENVMTASLAMRLTLELHPPHSDDQEVQRSYRSRGRMVYEVQKCKIPDRMEGGCPEISKVYFIRTGNKGSFDDVSRALTSFHESRGYAQASLLGHWFDNCRPEGPSLLFYNPQSFTKLSILKE
jgi:hypothetical protein